MKFLLYILLVLFINTSNTDGFVNSNNLCPTFLTFFGNDLFFEKDDFIDFQQLIKSNTIKHSKYNKYKNTKRNFTDANKYKTNLSSGFSFSVQKFYNLSQNSKFFLHPNSLRAPPIY